MHNRLKILAIHRYFWPDMAPYAWILKEIASQWVKDGHTVDIITSQPSYKKKCVNQSRRKNEVIDGVKLHRITLPNETGKILMRIINAVRLTAYVVYKAVFKKRYDVIMVSTVPPVIGAACVALVSKLTGAKFIYHCMDIQPEVGQISGEFTNKWLFRMLRSLDHIGCKQAASVVVLSDDMKQTLSDRPQGHKYNIQIINNFVISSNHDDKLLLPFNLDKEKLNILFAGNIGRFQGLDIVIDTMKMLGSDQGIEFIFMGEGSEKSRLQTLSKGLNIHYIKQQSIHIAKLLMSQVDFGFVSLAKGVYKYAYPSKTMAYLAEGCPVIISAEKESELVSKIIRNGAGLAVEPNDVLSLHDLLINIKNNKNNFKPMRQKATIFCQHNFNQKKIMKQWSELVLDGNS